MASRQNIGAASAAPAAPRPTPMHITANCSSDKCEAVWYCSEGCRQGDWERTGPLETYSHGRWCARLRGYMQLGQQLALLPFTFMHGMMAFWALVSHASLIAACQLASFLLKFWFCPWHIFIMLVAFPFTDKSTLIYFHYEIKKSVGQNYYCHR